jgi:hypothetical protein
MLEGAPLIKENNIDNVTRSEFSSIKTLQRIDNTSSPCRSSHTVTAQNYAYIAAFKREENFQSQRKEVTTSTTLAQSMRP